MVPVDEYRQNFYKDHRKRNVLIHVRINIVIMFFVWNLWRFELMHGCCPAGYFLRATSIARAEPESKTLTSSFSPLTFIWKFNTVPSAMDSVCVVADERTNCKVYELLIPQNLDGDVGHPLAPFRIKSLSERSLHFTQALKSQRTLIWFITNNLFQILNERHLIAWRVANQSWAYSSS